MRSSHFTRNRLRLSEPPLATIFGIISGPRVSGILDPEKWSLDDVFMQEFTQVILGLQVIAAGVETPRGFFTKN